MKIRCLPLITLTAALFFFLSIDAGAGDKDASRIANISGPFGTGTYVISAALGDISKKWDSNVRITVSESPGYVFNIKKLDMEPAMKKTTIIGSGAVLNWMAGKGLKPFHKKYEMVKLIGNYFLVSNWLATLDPNIKSIKDLIGKKVALGRAPQINWTVEPIYILKYGWGIIDKIKIQKVGTKAASTALLDGLVDAAIVGGYFNPSTGKISLSPATVELVASGRKIYFLPWGKEAIENVKKKTGMPLIPINLPANTIKGQDESIEIYTDTAGWWASSEFPENMAYELTKAMLKNINKFGSYGSIGKMITPANLAYSSDINAIHPGALKAYKEAGIIK